MDNRSSSLYLKLTILLLSLAPVETSAIAMPTLGAINQAFPNTDFTLIGLIMTLPVITMFIFNIVLGKISLKYDRKTLLTIGLIIYIIGGIGPALFENIYWILAMRAILGIGVGFCAPLAMGLIAELFEDPHEKASLMGYSQAISSLGSAVLTAVAGFVAVVSWRLTYLLYLMFAIVLILELVFLPSIKPGALKGGPGPEEGRAEALPKIKLPLEMYALIFIAFVLTICIGAQAQKTPLFIMDEKLGNPATMGLLLSVLNICGFLAGLLFGQAFKLFKKYLLPSVILLQAVSAFLLAIARQLSYVVVSQGLMGFAGAIVNPYMNNHVTSIVPKTHKTMAAGYMFAANALGTFASTFAISLLVMITNNPATRFLYSVITVILVVLAVIATILAAQSKARIDISPGKDAGA
ncbi:MFS transporter [Moorella sulfitireducens]|uniref:MFS transporter n=1 Tax=Neomoorella sulfitireducens TaxID=2972948 RepID=UPI0021AC3666|nr:MFS transporter [Moorella sulfitireducens]